jgi:CTD kinase subunit gamma
VQAQPHPGPAAPPSSTFVLASFLPLSDAENPDLALDIEFENEWEATSDWNEDDVEVIAEERELCYPHLRRRGAANDEEYGEQEMEID